MASQVAVVAEHRQTVIGPQDGAVCWHAIEVHSVLATMLHRRGRFRTLDLVWGGRCIVHAWIWLALQVSVWTLGV